ncbi:hypothetical protein FA15DRAFT_665645 [Coprinopsis marcescibilis]|uniref:CWH43-like N-terminal domain-containing protein n=1 Tax=Coprinopsis marcescibilis TaxID=230819 RepID=A0A5C3LHZ4_COPMA|nr:hypothetical protein FA15DRAFT_665645 [Coprinopsis marcescibilis]
MIVWLASGQPKYPSQDGRIAYISDIGASYLKPLFVAGCSFTAVGFSLCLIVERYLRYSGRLLPHMRKREKILSTLAVLGAMLGGCGLILLSVFDTMRYPSVHRVFLLVFMAGVALSAIFTCVEYRWISKDFVFAKELRAAYWSKAIIVTILICLSIAFAITLFTASDVGAVLEWLISFSFTAYIMSYFFDLRMSKGRYKGELHASVDMSQVLQRTSSDS